jgi:soluble lytic murein transglycosylase-like protein
MELALAISLLVLVLEAGFWRPPGFHPLHDNEHGAVSAASAPRASEPSPPADPRALLDAAAARHGLPAHLVEAVAYWESGWDQSKVSDTGAIGLMQVQPDVAAELGPRLLGRVVDLRDPAQNADAGAAILKAYIDDQGGDVDRGLAAYYQGPQSLADDGVQPDTERYVSGIDSLRQLLDEGKPLPPSPGG